jgi:hypothetical protein
MSTDSSEAPAPPSAESDAGRPKRPPVAPWLVGVSGVLLAVAAGVVQAIAIAQASNLNWERGTLLAWVAIALSVAAFVVGLAAVILNRGRRWGVVAMIAGLIANPFLLARLLGAFG